MGGSRSAWGGQIQPKYMALGNLLSSRASATTIAQAAAMFPEIHLPYANYAGSIAQMLKQFPQIREKVQLVVNRLPSRGAVDQQQIEQSLGLPVLATIPSDGYLMTTAVNEGVP